MAIRYLGSIYTDLCKISKMLSSVTKSRSHVKLYIISQLKTMAPTSEILHNKFGNFFFKNYEKILSDLI